MVAQGVCNGPEPLEADFPVGDMELVPPFVEPQPRQLPTWSPPVVKVGQVDLFTVHTLA
jgi:hypothetical protein